MKYILVPIPMSLMAISRLKITENPWLTNSIYLAVYGSKGYLSRDNSSVFAMMQEKTRTEKMVDSQIVKNFAWIF